MRHGAPAHPGPRRRRPRACARLAARRRARRRRGHRGARQPRHGGAATDDLIRARRGSARLGAVVALARNCEPSTSSSSAPRRRSPAGVADALARGRRRRPSGPARPPRASRAARRSAATSRAAAGVPDGRRGAPSTRSSRRGPGGSRPAVDGRVVIKADGLAAGKGVTVCDVETAEARAAAVVALEDGHFGAGRRRVVVEERLTGREASVIAICDGRRAWRCPPPGTTSAWATATTGPNTGGMGAYSPLPDLDDAAVAAILATVHAPDPGRDGPARDAVPRRPLRRPDADRRRPGAARVQRPASAIPRRRSSCRGSPCRSGRSWRRRARAGCDRRGGLGLTPRAVLPADRRARPWRSCSPRRATRATPRAATPSSGLRRRARAAAPRLPRGHGARPDGGARDRRRPRAHGRRAGASRTSPARGRDRRRTAAASPPTPRSSPRPLPASRPRHRAAESAPAVGVAAR